MNIYGDVSEFDPFNNLRIRFLNSIAEEFLPPADLGRSELIIVTHLLPDRPALLSVLARFFTIGHVFGIPYSTNKSVARWVSHRFPISQPSLPELLEGTPITPALLSSLADKVILLDIGGYAAQIISRAHHEIGDRLSGVVEGTEAGLVRYSETGPHHFPLVSMSLSPTKAAESSLVGPSCLFSVDRILRAIGFTNELRSAVVLGYGRVGKSVAEACRSRGLLVFVYDREPERCVQALADGFLVPERDAALAKADLVLAATGQRSWYEADASVMRDGAFLASCSSKDVEFNFATIKQTHKTAQLNDWVHLSVINGKHLYFIFEGRPVNFGDGANLGPLLTLVQGELLAVCGDLLKNRFERGIQEPLRDTRRGVIKEWIDHYIDPRTGWYKRRTIRS